MKCCSRIRVTMVVSVPAPTALKRISTENMKIHRKLRPIYARKMAFDLIYSIRVAMCHLCWVYFENHLKIRQVEMARVAV